MNYRDKQQQQQQQQQQKVKFSDNNRYAYELITTFKQ